jgi:hypothetical protein
MRKEQGGERREVTKPSWLGSSEAGKVYVAENRGRRVHKFRIVHDPLPEAGGSGEKPMLKSAAGFAALIQGEAHRQAARRQAPVDLIRALAPVE